ncbi:TMV resistance protein N-like protein [Tanacetum coccineum]
MSSSEHTAYPVFYDVEPTEIRKQSGVVGEAFAKHEKEEAAGKWREVLSEASNLPGWELKNTNDGTGSRGAKLLVPNSKSGATSAKWSLAPEIAMDTRIQWAWCWHQNYGDQ